ncbi:PHP domain-containing protein [Oscillospiraceae bacterium OttesenSCG-928-G22]|nr:PHP domain-containing protein [Oscillospiraceae bacterium OttesenSCG-928-G22]
MNEYYFDLHIHSCLSPCGDDEMTPHNIAAMASLAGLQLIAVSDHNSTRNVRAAMAAANEFDILVVPAMELTTAEEAHVLCLLPDADAADAFCRYVYSTLPDMKNDVEVFGSQRVMDGADNILDEEELLLAGATSISIDSVARLLGEYGGVAIPAHIDRPAFSVLSNLGFLDPELGFTAAEVTRNADKNNLLLTNPELSGLPWLTNSDAHYLTGILDAEYTLALPEKTAAAVISAVRRGALPGTL